MANTLEGKRIAFLFTEGVEQVELTEPLAAARKAGAETGLVSLEQAEVRMFNHLDKGDTIEADRAVVDAGSVGLRRPRASGRGGEPGRPPRRRGRSELRLGLLRPGQAGGGDLPRSLDADRGRRRSRPDADLVADGERP